MSKLNIDALTIFADLGISGVSLYIFYRIIMAIMRHHREERESDAQLWRDEIKQGRETTERVVNSLYEAIRESNQNAKTREKEHEF